MTADLLEQRRLWLIRDLIISEFNRRCICSDTYQPCRRCNLLAESERLFPTEYAQVASVIALRTTGK